MLPCSKQEDFLNDNKKIITNKIHSVFFSFSRALAHKRTHEHSQFAPKPKTKLYTIHSAGILFYTILNGLEHTIQKYTELSTD